MVKKSLVPYNIEDVKIVLLKKKYNSSNLFPYKHYERIITYFFPHLTNYYLKKLFQNLVEENFLVCVKYNKNNKKYYYIRESNPPEKFIVRWN